MCSYIKCIAITDADWDEHVSDAVLKLCDEVEARLAGDGDPAQDYWQAPTSDAHACTVWTDALDVGLGTAVEMDEVIMEDWSWLRPHDNKQRINIVKLEAAIQGLSLAASWDAQHSNLITDSKTVAGWLKDVAGDLC